jgi:CheY-like chemotaxis protein
LAQARPVLEYQAMDDMRVLIVAGTAGARDQMVDAFGDQAEPLRIETVPTGEDALLEFARQPVDILITDLELPGMSGLELVAWACQLNPRSRSILFASAPDEAALEQARSLGVTAFLAKPVSPERLAKAVQTARLEVEGGEIPATTHRAASIQLIRMMARARRVLGASGALILDVMGDVVAAEGAVGPIDIETLQSSLANVLGASLEVSSWLGSQDPWAFHVFEGVGRGCYFTNIGGRHGLVIYFESERTPGQQEAAARYCRDAVKGMAPLVKRLAQAGEEELPAGREMMMDHEERQGLREQLQESGAAQNGVDAERFWDKASTDLGGEGDYSEGVMSYEEAKKRGLLSDELETPEEE